MNSHFALPRTAIDWRQLALALADLEPGSLPAEDRCALEQLRRTAWDVASYAAFWRTVQLPSLGPGLLPWVVVLVLTMGQAASGRLSGPWLSLSNPIFLWSSLWLLGWFGLTLGLAPFRHARAKLRVLRLGARYRLFA